jgi:hypothetical protein
MRPNAYGFDGLTGLAGPIAVDGVSGTLLGEAGIQGLGGPTGAGATSSSFAAHAPQAEAGICAAGVVCRLLRANSDAYFELASAACVLADDCVAAITTEAIPVRVDVAEIVAIKV